MIGAVTLLNSYYTTGIVFMGLGGIMFYLKNEIESKLPI